MTTRDTASAILFSHDDRTVELRPPQTEYALRMCLAEGTSLDAIVGKRVSGTIEGRALQVHANAGGGRFVEPLAGRPRIICGSVVAVDPEARRMLVHAVMPMWLTCDDDQDFGVVEDAHRGGNLVNCYVQSGMTFRPADVSIESNGSA